MINRLWNVAVEGIGQINIPYDAHTEVIKSDSLARVEDLRAPSSTPSCTLPLDPYAVCRTLSMN